MNLDEILRWGLAFITVANAVAAVVLWLRRPGDDAMQTATVALGKIAAIETRQAVLEERLNHMPTSDELTELEGTVRELNSSLKGMREFQDSLRATLSRVEGYLLSQGNRS